MMENHFHKPAITQLESSIKKFETKAPVQIREKPTKHYSKIAKKEMNNENL